MSMINVYPKFAHTALITGATGCGKSYFVMKLLNNEYKNHFDDVVIFCPTFQYNDTYLDNQHLFYNDRGTRFSYYNFPNDEELDRVLKYFTDLHNNKNKRTLFILDDLAADKGIVKKRGYLNRLAISGRHMNISLWVLTQKYNSIGKDVRDQAMWIVSFYTKDVNSFNNMMKENDVEMELNVRKNVRSILMKNHRSKLLLLLFDPIGYRIIYDSPKI